MPVEAVDPTLVALQERVTAGHVLSAAEVATLRAAVPGSDIQALQERVLAGHVLSEHELLALREEDGRADAQRAECSRLEGLRQEAHQEGHRSQLSRGELRARPHTSRGEIRASRGELRAGSARGGRTAREAADPPA